MVKAKAVGKTRSADAQAAHCKLPESDVQIAKMAGKGDIAKVLGILVGITRA